MKIRIEDNSVRIRLRRSEVERLAEKGNLWATTQFPEGAFTYGLVAKQGLLDLVASLEEGKIVIYMPEEWTQGWPASPRVGYEVQADGKGHPLHILIEKDFVCLDRDLAGQADQYPHPKA
jgi:hypothetical protein